MRPLCLLRSLAALMVCATAGCAVPPKMAAPPQGELAARRVTDDDVAHKVVLVHRLLNDSPVATRVRASRDREAQRQLRAAAQLFERARSALNAGDLRRADGFLDDALRLVTAAGRAVPERERTLSEQQARYSELLASIETFRSWNDRVSGQKRAVGSLASSVNLDADRTRTIMNGAAALARSGDIVGANKLLAEAQANITWTLNQLVANETFVYRLEFASPRDEYRYEQERYASYEELLPVAVGALTPSSEAGLRADRLFGEAEDLRLAAARLDAGGDHPAAVVQLRAAIAKLQLAFESFGVVVPQQMPADP